MNRKPFVALCSAVGLALALVWLVIAHSAAAEAGVSSPSGIVTIGHESRSEGEPSASLGRVSSITFTPSFTAYLPIVTSRFPPELEELVPGVSWGSWYKQQSGYNPDSDHFGAYVTLAVGPDLYVGLGTARPAEKDGALVALFDGQNLVSIGALTEQGIHEMVWDDEAAILHIAGTDPCCGDGWDAGNHYTYSPPGPLVKHRDPVGGLIDVVHTWGLWMSDDGKLYAAVSRVDGGQIFASVDNGVRWDRVGGLGNYRAYDIAGFGNKLYATYNDFYEEPPTLAVSEDGGVGWSDVIADVYVARLAEFRDELLVVSFDRGSIYAVGNGEVTRYYLPVGLEIGARFNVLAVGDGYLYAICENVGGGADPYAIVRTSDLLDWEHVVDTDKELISLSYWRNQDWLIAGDAGAQAKLWKLAVP